MTTTATNAFTAAVASGVNPVPFTFQAISPEEVGVLRAGTTELSYGADFGVTLNGDGTGEVTPGTSWDTDDVIVYSKPSFRQPSDFTRFGAFYPDQFVPPLDRLARALIALKQSAALLPIAIATNAAARADKFFAFDSFGNPTVTSGTILTIVAPFLSPELFASAKPSGVVGDGTDDAPAFTAMNAVLNAAGQGTIELKPGVVYWVGGQTLHNPGASLEGSPAIYRFAPNTLHIIDINGCTGPVVLRWNGATIRCIAGLKYGNFNLDGTPWNNGPTYSGDGVATPYYTMLRIKNCSGPVFGDGGLELDGNIKNASIGGPWAADGSGRQIRMVGYVLEDNTGGIDLGPIYSHHHGQDGAIGNGLGLLNAKEKVTLRGHRCLNNGRNNFSLVGGNGWRFVDCSFNQAGKDIAPMTYSAPGAGFDIEAEGGRYVTNLIFDNTECVDNTVVGLIADTNAFINSVTCTRCKLIGTTSWSLWALAPRFRLYDCLIVGAFANLYSNIDPELAAQLYRCRITDEVTLSPTGVVYGGGSGYIHFDAGGLCQNIRFDSCRWTKSRSGGDSINGTFPTSIDGNGLIIHNNTVERLVGVTGHFFLYGIYSGERTNIINVIGIPSPAAAALFLFEFGPSLDSFIYDGSVVFSVPRARFPASIDRKNGDALGVRTNAADANATLTPGTDARSQRFTGVLTADRTVTLSTTGAKEGNRFRISRTGGGAFNLNVGTGPLKAMATNTWAEFEYDATGPAWRLAAAGAL